jgi:hypothetical protein
VLIVLASAACFSSASVIALCLTHARSRLYACAWFMHVRNFLAIRGDQA